MNRSIILVLLVLFSILVSCQRDRPHRDLLEKDELIPILIDLHRAYAIQSSVKFRKISLDVDSVDLHAYIFDKHNVSKVIFDSSIAWYSRHPTLFAEIYDEVIMDLTQMRDSLEVKQLE
jgi:hypothetical protein